MLQHLSLSKVVFVLAFIVILIGLSASIFNEQTAPFFNNNIEISKTLSEEPKDRADMDKGMVDEIFSKCYIFTNLLNYLQLPAGNNLFL